MSQGLCLLGCTGSVGQNCLRVLDAMPGLMHVVALSAGKNLETLAAQVAKYNPQVVVVGERDYQDTLRTRLQALGHKRPLKIVCGVEGQVEAVTHHGVDFVVSAAHGVTGLVATYEAVRAGKRLGLANKETLVAAGELVMKAAEQQGTEVLPIDSEHCAVHQCLRSGQRSEIKRILLTGSGGPFLETPQESFDSITPDQALNHPVWRMGGRITIDSATLMNKGLEIIEARWLFGVPSERIEVVIHPESIIHSMIEFCDGTVMAQMSVPDMRMPIQYALTYPSRQAVCGDSLGLDLFATHRLNFQPPDTVRFLCLGLARDALKQGGIMPCVLNAADEVAVEAFLGRRLRFSSIPQVIETVMGQMAPGGTLGSLTDVLEGDREARLRARQVVTEISTKE